ncbi:MAG: hypothetical protein LBD52_08525 [Prevotellaceae bacterium]|jgi:hypothetical protein|nr:hypothetical protein [Prevotellaceae bacterium]
MKKIKFYLLVLIAGALALNACREKEDVFLPASEYFVSITKNSALVVQAGDILKLPVVIAAPKGKAIDVVYNFDPNTDTTQAVLGVDFWIVDAKGDSVSNYSLTFPEGTGTDTIYVYAPFTGNTNLKQINLVLKSNTAGYNLGMSTLQGAKCVLSVAYPSLDDFVGEYTAETFLFGATPSIVVNNLSISRGVGDTLLLSGLFAETVPKTDEAFYNHVKDIPVKIAVNINTMTYTIPGQFICEYVRTSSDALYFGDILTGAGLTPQQINITGGLIDYSERVFWKQNIFYWGLTRFKNGKKVDVNGYNYVYGVYLELYMKK